MPVRLLLPALVLAAGGWAVARPAAPRAIVVLSDLHMGAGRDPSGRWHPYEDFRWAAELSAFLRTIDEQGRGAVDLVLNGDTFDLLQSPDVDCSGGAPEAGCTEAQALARLERILASHGAEINALAAFARAGANRIAFVPGDHDAALLFGPVGRRAIDALRSPAGRVTVAAAGHWLSADGKVYAEHGHQIGFSPHRFADWPRPFVRREGRTHLARSPGERTIQDLYNRLEERYATVDNVATAGSGVKYALAADATVDAGDAAPALLRHLLFSISWQQFRMELDDGEVQPPMWDIAKARAQGASLLVSSVPDDDPLKPIAARALADGDLADAVRDLSDEEITALCDYRAAVRRARRRFEPAVSQFAPRGAIVAECPRTPETRGSIFDYFWRSRDEVFGRYVETVARRLKQSRPPVVFVHGHSHLADRAQSSANMISGGLLKIPMEGFSPVRGALTPIVINGGAWQRTITPAQLERLRAERAVSWHDLLRSLEPEQLAPCYSFVHIPAYTNAPDPAVRYWRQSADGDWSIAPACGR